MRIDVLEFLESLNLRNINDEGDEVRFSCPFPGHKHGDSSASAYMNKESTAFFCHGCKMKGNAAYFLSRFKNIDIIEASREIKKLDVATFKEPEGGSFEKEFDRLVRKDLYEEKRNRPIYYSLDPLPDECSQYLRDRGFDNKTIDTWAFGYDPNTDRIGIPIRNDEANLIGFKARAYKEGHQPKYLILGDREGKEPFYHFPTYDVSKVLFGLDDACQDSDIIVVEGELNVISLWQMGIPNAVALNGSHFSETQKNLLLGKAGSVTLWLDDDAAGWSCAKMIAKAIAPIIPVRAAWSDEDAAEYLARSTTKKLVYDIVKNATSVAENII